MPVTRFVSTVWPRPLLSLQKRGEHTLHSGVGGSPRSVGKRGVGRSRPGRQSALLVHDAGFRHYQGFPALVVTERPGRPPTRDRRCDESRVGVRHRLFGKPDTLRRGRPHRVHHDVGAAQQRTQALQIRVIMQVQCHAALAAKQGGPACELAQRTTVGRLDHDHLGAAISEKLRRLRSGQRRRQVDHHDAGQRTVRRDFGHICSLPPAGNFDEDVQ